MKVFITGITGFKGSHLAEYLLSQGLEVYGSSRWRSKTNNIDGIMDKVHLINGDIRDAYSMRQAIDEVKPDYVFHLAAQSWVAESWRSPHETLYTNAIGTLNVLEAVRLSKCDCTVVVAGSSEEYGKVYPDEVPIKESNPLRPLSPYGVSKVTTDLLTRQYFNSYGVKTIVTRAFNTTGPRRGEVFVTSFYAKRIARIMLGLQKPLLPLGNMEAYRDFTDVRDMVKAYWLAGTKGKPGEVYNMCSGITRKVGDVVDMQINLSGVKVETEIDQSLMRPSDVPILQGDCSKFIKQTGWQPTIPFEKTMVDLIDYWVEVFKMQGLKENVRV